jgi:pilus assembly protein TadC
VKSLFERICITLSRVLPKQYLHGLRETIKYSGRKHDAPFLSGLAVFIAVLILLAGSITKIFLVFETNVETVDGITQIVGFTAGMQLMFYWGIIILLVLLIFFLIYVYYFLLMEHRSSYVDKVLPDALVLIASNLRSGETPFHAVKKAIRSDFGPLAEAFEIATTQALGKRPFGESLIDVSKTIKSHSLQRAMKLFSVAIESGSNVARLLDSISQDITQRQSLKFELVTSTKTNSMFIIFMVVIGAPILLAISIFFVDVVDSIQTQSGGIDSATADSLGFGGGGIQITSAFLTNYSYVLLFITGFLVAYFTGVMIHGDGKSGLRSALPIIIASYVVFYIAQFVVENMLGGLFS